MDQVLFRSVAARAERARECRPPRCRQPRDGVGSSAYMHYHADYNSGTNTIYAGGEKDSYLLLSVIPMNR